LKSKIATTLGRTIQDSEENKPSLPNSTVITIQTEGSSCGETKSIQR